MASQSLAEQRLELLADCEKAVKTNQLRVCYLDTSENGHEGGPYPWQVEFHDAGVKWRQRAIIAANKTGKTRSISAEVAMHLTGWYPDWWTGKRFYKAVRVCVAGITNEETRNICQKGLFGDVEGAENHKKLMGDGWIPASAIGTFTFRQCGVANVLDIVKVKHVTGEWSTCMFKSFVQGSAKFQGFDSDVMWFDEEPDSSDIFYEALTRLTATAGIFLWSRTPLLGMSDMARHFLEGDKPGVWHIGATVDDAPHLSREIIDEMRQSYQLHQLETRLSGIPMMGTGAVYPVADELLLCDPVPIPAHYRRICGIDFGIDHPGAAAWLAHDTDHDIIYLTDCYKQSGETPAYHAQAIMTRGSWIPVAWPHDGMARDKGSGIPLMAMYRDRGVNMTGEPAQWDAEYQQSRGVRAQSREAGAIELLERMNTGRFKVFNSPAGQLFLQEKRMMHRKDGKIVAINDDIESAVRYAMMMLRYAVSDDTDGRLAKQPAFDLESAEYDPLAEHSHQSVQSPWMR